MEDLSTIERRASRIKLLLMDCDGVLTDGRFWLHEGGEEQKAFHVRDGLGLDLWHRSGLKSGIISGRNSKAVDRRASELQIDFVCQGEPNKVQAFERVLAQSGVDDSSVAYIGDDLNDIRLMKRSELSFAVADAAEEAKAVAHFVTKSPGGFGAVREVVEIILKAQGRWSDIVRRYARE